MPEFKSDRRISQTKNLKTNIMKIIQVLVMLSALTFAIKQVQLLLKQQIEKCDELPEIEEEEM